MDTQDRQGWFPPKGGKGLCNLKALSYFSREAADVRVILGYAITDSKSYLSCFRNFCEAQPASPAVTWKAEFRQSRMLSRESLDKRREFEEYKLPFQLTTIQIILSPNRGTSLFEGRKLRLIGGAAGVAVLLFVYFVAPTFFAPANLVNLLRQTAINGIIASGMTILMISGGFDLSVGGMVALSGVLAIHFAQHSVFFGAAISVLFGAVAGCGNGIIVSRFSINPLIVTIGTRYLLYAAANLWTSGFTQYNQNPSFLLIGRSSWLGIPMPGIIFICVALAAHLLL